MYIKLSIKNYKLIKDLDVELQDSNVYIVSGQNEVGKSSVLEAFKSLMKAKNDTKVPVRHGAKETEIIGIIEDNKGNTYSVTMEATDTGKIKFTMVSKEGIKTTSVTSIRDVFAYQDFTAEEFVSWGTTAEGRRKQSEIFLQCLDEETQKLYNEILLKEKGYYDTRTPVLSDISHYTKRLKELNITDEQKELLENDYVQVLEQINTIKEEADKAKLSNTKIDSIKSQIKEVNDAYQNASNDIINNLKSVDEQIKALNKRKEELLQTGNDYDRRYKTRTEQLNEELKSYTEIKFDQEKYDKALAMEKLIRDAEYVYNDYKLANDKLKELEVKKKDLDTKVDEMRDMKKDIIKSNPILEDVAIEEDGIYIVNGDTVLPFSDTQIATSKQMIIAAKILLKLNSNFPILLIGRGESLDRSKMDQLHKLAEENKAIIVLEKVTETGGLRIETLIEE